MPRCHLHPHPSHPCPIVDALSVDWRMDERGLSLTFTLFAQLEALAIPSPAPSGAADGLWQHTCFEAFITDGTGRYREFNFSPSGQWAAYEFQAYRQRDPSWSAQEAPTLNWDAASGTLHAHIPPPLLPAQASRLALSSVIEDRNGQLGYWAFCHPAQKADFHDMRSFALFLQSENPS